MKFYRFLALVSQWIITDDALDSRSTSAVQLLEYGIYDIIGLISSEVTHLWTEFLELYFLHSSKNVGAEKVHLVERFPNTRTDAARTYETGN